MSCVFQLYSSWQQEKAKREQAYVECSYYIEKAKQLENEMQQLTDVAYTTPVSRSRADGRWVQSSVLPYLLKRQCVYLLCLLYR